MKVEWGKGKKSGKKAHYLKLWQERMAFCRIFVKMACHFSSISFYHY